MRWSIEEYQTSRGIKPVIEFIRSLNKVQHSQVLKKITLLEKFGSFVSPPNSKRITSELSELRIVGKMQIRIIYAIIGQRVILLHAFIKKSRRLNNRDIATAQRRYKQISL